MSERSSMPGMRGHERDLGEVLSTADRGRDEYGLYEVGDADAAVGNRAAILAYIVETVRPLIGHSEALTAALSDLDTHDAERDEVWRLAAKNPP